MTSLRICRTAAARPACCCGPSRGGPGPQGCANAHAATADLGQATRKVDALITDLASRQIPEKAGELVDDLRGSAQIFIRSLPTSRNPIKSV